MLSTRFCRYLLTLLLLVGITITASALEVGDRVFGSELAADIEYAQNFHGKVNVYVINYMPPNPRMPSPERSAGFMLKYNTAVTSRQVSKAQETGLLIIDKSGYVRWKHTDEIEDMTIENLRAEFAKLKRNTPLPIGSSAPDFNLTEADGKTQFKLSDYKGKKNVLVSLLLQTYSPVCANYTAQFATDRKLFTEKYDTVVVTIKPEPLSVIAKFKDTETMDIPLLADPGSSVHEAYGIVKPYPFHHRDMYRFGKYRPATFLIDKEGNLKWLYIGKRNSDRPARDLILEQLSQLQRK